MQRTVRKPEFQREAVELRREGRSLPEIAEIMGYSCMMGVLHHLQRHGDPELLKPIKRRSKPHPEWWAKAMQLCREGWADHVVAGSVGRSTTAVREARYKLGVPTNPRHLTRGAATC